MTKIYNILEKNIHPTLIVVVSLVIAIGLKWIILINEKVPFNSDEAIVALMARHILTGDRPIFFYGQSYMGSLDAWLVSFGFLLFGESVWVVRFIQTILYCGTILTTYWLGRIIFNSSKIGSLGALLLAVPTVNVMLYTTVSLGGYGEALLIGNLIFICAIYLGRYTENNDRNNLWLWFTLGFLGGVGFWSFGIILIYFLPVLVYLFYRTIQFYRGTGLPKNNVIKAIFRGIVIGIIGWIIGSLPLLFYGYQSGWLNMIWEYTGGAIAGVEGVAYPYQVRQHVLNFLILGISAILGFRPPWASNWLALPLIPFILLFWVAVGWFAVMDIRYRSNKLRAEKLLLLAPIVILLMAFIFSPFGADPSGRYFIPVVVPMSLFAAGMIIYAKGKNALFATGLFLLVMGFHLWGFIQITHYDSTGFTTQFDSVTQVNQTHMEDLIEFLQDNGELRG
ncbi:MAG: glycosyltransferase family 39 protein, partial [Anaerolineales bacterium]|nr:glycosyltransferase family 39 protein [Anaerolineales bacterium]